MVNPERPFVNISPTARRLQREGLWDGFEETQIDKPFSEMNRDELASIATAWKVERFALASVIANRVIDRALRTTLAEAIPERLPYPHTNVPAFTRYALQTALIEEFKDLNALINEGSQDPIAGVYTRYWEVMAKNPDKGDMRLPDSHLLSGIQTAVQVMSQTYNVIGEVYEREMGERPTEGVQKSIAANSFSVVSMLASLHIVDFAVVREYISLDDDRLGLARFDPRKFALEDFEAGFRLYLKDNPMNKKGKLARGMQKLLRSLEVNTGDNLTPRARCIAMVNYGEGSAIKRLWDFYITL
ncbi:MAG: hypothetical protein HY427_01940 [Candidatus Levybacteria bacterium]|nr:hypothetical protein [Candidatus Levybacteria bacterium]